MVKITKCLLLLPYWHQCSYCSVLSFSNHWLLAITAYYDDKCIPMCVNPVLNERDIICLCFHGMRIFSALLNQCLAIYCTVVGQFSMGVANDVFLVLNIFSMFIWFQNKKNVYGSYRGLSVCICSVLYKTEIKILDRYWIATAMPFC